MSIVLNNWGSGWFVWQQYITATAGDYARCHTLFLALTLIWSLRFLPLSQSKLPYFHLSHSPPVALPPSAVILLNWKQGEHFTELWLKDTTQCVRKQITDHVPLLGSMPQLLLYPVDERERMINAFSVLIKSKTLWVPQIWGLFLNISLSLPKESI